MVLRAFQKLKILLSATRDRSTSREVPLNFEALQNFPQKKKKKNQKKTTVTREGLSALATLSLQEEKTVDWEDFKQGRIFLLLIWSLRFMLLSCWVCAKKVADPDKDDNRGGCSILLLRHSITDLVDTKATVRSYFEVDTFPMGQNTKSRRHSGICWRFQGGSSNTEVA